MPQFAPIALGEGLPSLSPKRINGNVAEFTDYNIDTPELRPTMTISLNSPSKTSKLYKARLKLTMPAEGEVYDPVTNAYIPDGKVAALVSCDVNFIFPSNSTETQRDILYQSLVAALQNLTIVNPSIKDLQPIY